MALLSVSNDVLAQETEPPENAAPSEGDASDSVDPSQETDISEDNYRRFMELDDRRLERPAFAPGGVQPANTLQKLGALPESSQKHLRNQLRGIILSRGAWTPGEREQTYTFVPSAEARANAQRGDGQLLQQEAEAWSELVTEYHDREAAIFAGATGQDGQPGAEAQPGQPSGSAQAQSAPAVAQANQQPGQPGNGGQEGQDQAQNSGQNPGQNPGRNQGQGQAGSDGGADSQGHSASETAAPRERPEIPEYTADDGPSQTPAPPGNEGVEQSASDYLQERGLVAGEPVNVEASRSGARQENAGPADRERALRWGEEAQTLLPDLGRTAPPAGDRNPPTAETGRPNEPPPVNSLTREELLQVRGVTVASPPSEDAFADFVPGAPQTPTAPVPEEEEAPSEPIPDEEDDGSP